MDVPPRPTATLTLREVASIAAVSPSTVSLVLKGSELISGQTRRRVERVLEQTNYRRRPVGRPRTSRKAYHIALVHPSLPATSDRRDLATTVTFVWLNAIRDVIVRANHHVALFGGHPHVKGDMLFQEVVRRGELDGMILLGSRQDGYLDWVLEQQLPAIVVNRRPALDGHPFSYVDVDNFGGGEIAAGHLIRRGHRKLAVITDHVATSFSEARVAGFTRAVAAAGGAAPMLLRASAERREHTLDEFVRRLIDSEVTATFCGSDTLAASFLDACHRRSVAVPERMSVVGFDATGVASSRGVRPTSVAFNNDVIAQTAVGLLLKLVDAGSALRQMSAVVGTMLVNELSTVADRP